MVQDSGPLPAHLHSHLPLRAGRSCGYDEISLLWLVYESVDSELTKREIIWVELTLSGDPFKGTGLFL